MKVLNNTEVQCTSGGFDLPLILGIVAGKTGAFSQSNVVIYSAILGAATTSFYSYKKSAPLSVALTCIPLGAAFEAGLGYVGYGIGAYFHSTENEEE